MYMFLVFSFFLMMTIFQTLDKISQDYGIIHNTYLLVRFKILQVLHIKQFCYRKAQTFNFGLIKEETRIFDTVTYLLVLQHVYEDPSEFDIFLIIKKLTLKEEIKCTSTSAYFLLYGFISVHRHQKYKKKYSKVAPNDVTLNRENRLIKNTYFWCIYIQIQAVFARVIEPWHMKLNISHALSGLGTSWWNIQGVQYSIPGIGGYRTLQRKNNKLNC